jgi:hypothetical protein
MPTVRNRFCMPPIKLLSRVEQNVETRNLAVLEDRDVGAGNGRRPAHAIDRPPSQPPETMMTNGSAMGGECHSRRERVEKSANGIRYGIQSGDELAMFIQNAVGGPKPIECAAPGAGIALAEDLFSIGTQDCVVIGIGVRLVVSGHGNTSLRQTTGAGGAVYQGVCPPLQTPFGN